MTETAAPAWARGYDLEYLRALARIHQQADAPYALGAFSRVKENAVASWLAGDDEYGADADEGVAWRVSFPRVQVPVRDFTGQVRVAIPARSAIVRNVAALTPAAEAQVLELLRQQVPLTEGHDVWLEGWVESPVIQRLVAAAGLELTATKIKASSELVGVWGPAGTAYSWPAAEDHVTLGKLLRNLVVGGAAAEVAGMAGWADHYSSYNARHSWSALSLHGYVEPGQPADPAQIVKPAEMSKQWKAEHPGWEEWPVATTPLLERLPGVEVLLRRVQEALGVESWQRVRLMRLQPGGGELTRHSDITDPEAGTGDGKLARIHVPLITNPDVRFQQWRLDGRQVEAHMAAGEVWYLDTRKPHRAGNYGTTERVHLVADAYGTAELRARIAASEEAPELRR